MTWPLGLLVVLMVACACGSGSAEDGSLGIRDGRLTPCPDTPNCVSSDASDDEHRVDPLALAAGPEEAWTVLHGVLGELPRTRVVEERDRYLHAEVTSLVFRFVDDVEFHLRPGEGVIAVRSASRVGRSDLGVNRRRVETIREALRDRGAVR